MPCVYTLWFYNILYRRSSFLSFFQECLSLCRFSSRCTLESTVLLRCCYRCSTCTTLLSRLGKAWVRRRATQVAGLHSFRLDRILLQQYVLSGFSAHFHFSAVIVLVTIFYLFGNFFFDTFTFLGTYPLCWDAVTHCIYLHCLITLCLYLYLVSGFWVFFLSVTSWK